MGELYEASSFGGREPPTPIEAHTASVVWEQCLFGEAAVSALAFALEGTHAAAACAARNQVSFCAASSLEAS
jgi:hypothetical protein